MITERKVSKDNFPTEKVNWTICVRALFQVVIILYNSTEGASANFGAVDGERW